jgi:DNA polymerase III subunit alpha
LGADSFAHLHLHSQYSILDGAIDISALVARAADLGMPAVAVTDHGNMFGAIEFHDAARAKGIKPILGCEVYVAAGSRFDKDPSTGGFDGINHMVLLAADETGYKNLIKLVSKGFLEGFYYKPRVDRELLEAHNEGLIATSGCLSGAAPRAILAGKKDQAWETIERYSRIFKDRYYLEIQRHGIPDQDKVNEEMLKVSRDLGLPLLATNDSHYLNKDDAFAHEALLCVQTGKTLDDPTRFKFDGHGFYVKSAAEMLEVFHDLPQAVRNSVELAERCQFELTKSMRALKLPEFPVPPGETVDSYLEKRTWRGLRMRLTGKPDGELPKSAAIYEERIKYELGIIRTCGYSGYFLIVWDFIRFAKENGIPVGPGRGSSAGSLAAYALEIVDIDPVEHTIPFERFLNPERVSMPDIDVDLCMNRRGEVIKYVEDKYNGEGFEGRRVAGIATFGTMQAKAALRDVGRIRGMAFADVDRVAKLIPNTLGITLSESIQQSRELREAVEGDPNLKGMFDLALKLEGQIRNAGRHAAGVVISSRPLVETTALYRDSRTEEVVTQLDYRFAEKVGLIKFDLLGLRTLTIIHDTVERIRKRHDANFKIEGAPSDDVPTYEMLTRGDTLGVFQVGQSTGMTDLVMKMAPRRFEDLIPLVALYRPGVLQSGMHEDFVARRHGRTKVEYLLPELEEILAETYGVIVYQDQVMRIANRLASYSLGEGDLLRRAMGKKIPAEMAAQRQRFLEGCKKNGHPVDISERIFELVDHFAGYAFPKGHSAAYALVSHQTAYLKAHYPAEFYAATMTAEGDDSEKLDRYMKDARGRGIEIKPPDVNESVAEFSVTDDGRAVRFGMAGVKNVGGGAVEAILEARQAGGPFRSVFEFCDRVDAHRVNRRVIESLIKAAAFDFARASRAALTQALDHAIERGQRAQRDRAIGQRSLFGEVAQPALEPKLPDVPEWPRAELLAGEKAMLGFYVTGHPLRQYERALDQFASCRIEKLGDEQRGKEIRLGGLLNGLKVTRTKKGDMMARAELEDLSGAIAMVVFPRTYEACASILRTGEPVFVEGQIAEDSERHELRAENIVPVSAAWGRYTKELTLRLSAEWVEDKRLRDLRSILDLCPGPTPVSVALRLPDGCEAELALRDHAVAVSESLIRDIDQLFGASVVRCRL